MDKRLSIGARWTLRYTAVTVVLIGLVSSYLYSQIERHILDEAEAKLAHQILAVNETLGRDGRTPAVAEFVEVVIAGSRPDERLAIELFDDDGESWLRRDILAPFEEPLPDWKPLGPGERLLYRVDRGEPYPTFVMVAPNGRGLTRVALYGGPWLQSIERIRNVFLSVFGLGIVLTGLLGWWLARQSLRPIAEITATARRIRVASTGESIPVRGSGDELDELALTLNEMLARIRLGLERMRQFSADAAHELRTPLSVVQTRIEITLEKERSPEEYRRALEESLSDVERFGEGIGSILRLASSEAGIEPGRSQPVEIRPLLASVVDFFGPIADERGIRLELLPLDDVCVRGDHIWLDRLFANLVDNAIKYSNPGDSVKIEARQDAEFVTVVVCDTGNGIAPDERERIFERFYRGCDRETVSGIGIGLPLAQEIARAHGGSIEVESRHGGGSTFKVQLPRA